MSGNMTAVKEITMKNLVRENSLLLISRFALHHCSVDCNVASLIMSPVLRILVFIKALNIFGRT